MSSDQRPGKVRVFSSGTATPQPARRRGDRVEAAPVADPPRLPAPAAKPGGGRFLLLAGLFLLGCAVGGALLAWFGPMPGALS
ncbi:MULTISPECIES: hypothetical protein [unclassified Sphingobium]|uniref:hypothetical protein n=1 Tax=unclassified Sphingobium TaxID=2611147 RepID=UPI0007F365D9|nr:MULTISPECIES: hypothetical protein [unclassified Sphingobium]OAN54814.1 hypothetical protein A7Q26_22965 [Sphingobium sp. TCM1]WIW90556.1 hypothetical protein K3M67_21380 [Sphingobium sp. V4]